MPTVSRHDRTDWMNSCNGQHWMTSTSDDRIMHVPTVNPDSRHLPDIETQETLNPAKLRRRASQGSLRTRPSPVSRFLAKSSVAVTFPERSSSPGSPYRLESRTRSADSRLRLSTSVSRGPRPLSASPAWSPPAYPSDYPATLPPTPPEEDLHVAWNPKSEMLLFDAHSHPGPMAMMDHNPNVDNSSATGASDTFSNPSDGLSHRSSSAGGSPGPREEMDCQQDIGSWLDHGINLTGKPLGDPCVEIDSPLTMSPSVIPRSVQATRRSCQNRLPNASISQNLGSVGISPTNRQCLLFHRSGCPQPLANGPVALYQCHPCSARAI